MSCEILEGSYWVDEEHELIVNIIETGMLNLLFKNVPNLGPYGVNSIVNYVCFVSVKNVDLIHVLSEADFLDIFIPHKGMEIIESISSINNKIV